VREWKSKHPTLIFSERPSFTEFRKVYQAIFVNVSRLSLLAPWLPIDVDHVVTTRHMINAMCNFLRRIIVAEKPIFRFSVVMQA
jgi:hypothetical protein